MFEICCDDTEDKLRMSRSFGDFCLKQNTLLSIDQQAIIAVPEVEIHSRHSRDAFLVLACDGVWDVMSSQEVVDYIGDQLGYTAYGGPVGGVSTARAAHACDALLQLCLEKGTVDNLSVVLVVLGPPPNHLPYSVSSSSSSAYSKAQISSFNTVDHHNQQKRVLITPPGISTTSSTPTAMSNNSVLHSNQYISTSGEEDVEIAVEIPIFNHSEINTGSLNEVLASVAINSHDDNDDDDDDRNYYDEDDEEDEEDVSDDVIDVSRTELVVIDSDNIDDQLVPNCSSSSSSPLHTRVGSKQIRKHLTFND